MKKLTILFLLLATCAARAQVTNAPSTWFAAYNSTADTTLIRGTTLIGTLKGQTTFGVDVVVERMNIQPSTNTTYAVAIRSYFPNGPAHVDYIDYDELAGLISAITTMDGANHNIVPMDDFEVVYRLRCGMSVAKFSKGSTITIAIKCGDTNATRNYIAPNVLDDFQRLLTDAKSKIETIARSGQ